MSTSFSLRVQVPNIECRIVKKNHSGLLLLTFYFDQRFGAVHPESCWKSSFSAFFTLKSLKTFHKSKKIAAKFNKKLVTAPHPGKLVAQGTLQLSTLWSNTYSAF